MAGQLVVALIVAAVLLVVLGASAWLANLIINVGIFLEPWLTFPGTMVLLFALLTAGLWALLFKTL